MQFRPSDALLALVAMAGLASADLGRHAQVGGNLFEGTEVAIDLPVEQHVHNVAAPGDGAGCCVFASMDMAARWGNVKPLYGVEKKLRYGGGWPEKVDETFKQYAPDLSYAQYLGSDPTFLEAAIKTGRPVCVTYGYGERYGMSTIAHMVILVHFDSRLACIIDNNFPGTFEWMSRDEFLRRWKHPHGTGWAYVLLAPPPPPMPSN